MEKVYLNSLPENEFKKGMTIYVWSNYYKREIEGRFTEKSHGKVFGLWKHKVKYLSGRLDSSVYIKTEEQDISQHLWE